MRPAVLVSPRFWSYMAVSYVLPSFAAVLVLHAAAGLLNIDMMRSSDADVFRWTSPVLTLSLSWIPSQFLRLATLAEAFANEHSPITTPDVLC